MDKFDFFGKTCLITGGASGMGRAFARAFAKEGVNVVIGDINFKSAEEWANQLSAEGMSVKAIELDATSEKSVYMMAEKLKDKPPNILVNSIGVGAKAMPGEDELTIWNRIMDVNLDGVYRCCMAIGNLMVESGGGAIVNMASMSARIIPKKWRPGRLGENGLFAYCASKAGVRHLTQAIAALWAQYGIRANSVSPGYVDTPMNKDPFSDPQIRNLTENEIPLRKIAVPNDIVGAVLFLASPLSAYITGQDLVIDGGITAM
jgi:NAD(P)-dependent dehydrogenase (short-subunit alcohol dehydrogenase family)